MTKKSSIVVIACFWLIICFFAVGSIIEKDREFSDLENRNLNMMPEASAENVLKGTFMDELESYMADQIILKDDLVKLNSSYNYAINQKLQNETYICKDMYIEGYTYSKQFEKNLSFVNEFADNNTELECYMILAPTKSYIYSDRLPKYSYHDSEETAFSYFKDNASQNLNYTICDEVLMANKNESIYFNTDHHWNQNGAYLGYVTLCELMGIEPTAKSEFEVKEDAAEFYGSLYSKVPLYMEKTDSFMLYEHASNGDSSDYSYMVEYKDTGMTESSLYSYQNLLIKDKYTTYLGGNHSMVHICSEASDKEPIIIVKDSYAHALVPFFADNFGDIYMIDLRYYHESVSTLADILGAKRIVFIYNADFMTTDNNFLWLE